jgi:hypothetical protein
MTQQSTAKGFNDHGRIQDTEDTDHGPLQGKIPSILAFLPFKDGLDTVRIHEYDD